VELTREPDARPRLNVCLPNYYRNFAFGGIASALELARELSVHYPCVRFVSLAPLGEAAEMYDFPALAPGSEVETASLHAGAPLTCHQREVFLCTYWQTVHAWEEYAEAMRARGSDPPHFYYFIQDFEPGFYPWGFKYALAEATYSHQARTRAIFNSRELAAYFREQGYAFARETVLKPCLHPDLAAHIDSAGHVLPPKPESGMNILVYGRPNQPRNCFETVCEGLHLFAHSLPGTIRQQLLVTSAGVPHDDLVLAPGVVMRSVGKLDMDDYIRVMEQSHVGVSLMASPHPSYPPLEWAAFGIQTVTNDFGPKSLAGAHPGLICLPSPDPWSLARALTTAADAAVSMRGRPVRVRLPDVMQPGPWSRAVQKAGIEPIMP
jgi:hypothetical protein